MKMPEYRKKRVNRFKPAPRRKKKPIEAAEDIKMSPTEKHGKKTEKAESEEKNELPLRVVNGKKLERRRKTKIFVSTAAIIALILTVIHIILPVGITENLENLVSLIGNGSYPINLESSDTLNTVSRGMYYYVLTDTRLNAFTTAARKYIRTPTALKALY